jgi:hypothetical protein
MTACTRVILLSGVKVILNLTPLGVAAEKGWPLKNTATGAKGHQGSASSGYRVPSPASSVKQLAFARPQLVQKQCR